MSLQHSRSIPLVPSLSILLTVLYAAVVVWLSRGSHDTWLWVHVMYDIPALPVLLRTFFALPQFVCYQTAGMTRLPFFLTVRVDTF
jgi:hypothetical protein